MTHPAPRPSAPGIAIGPEPAPGWVVDAVQAGGGVVVPPAQAEGLIWVRPTGSAPALSDLLAASPAIRWVQLPWAGVEEFAATGIFADGRTWTCGKGVYAEPVAEHALGLAIAGLRDLPARITAQGWAPPSGRTLYDAPVTILGGGGITECLLQLLAPMRASVTVVRRNTAPLAGAARVVGPDRLHSVLSGASVVVLALALTPATKGIIGRAELERMADDAWLVNVARGAHVVTDDLVHALHEGLIGGAALDVTDPEPLPDAHPLWALPNCIITPHVANTPEMGRHHLAIRITENVARFVQGEDLLGPVDPGVGY